MKRYDSALLNARSDVPGVVWPPVSLGPTAVLTSLLHQLEMSQWLPREEIEKQQFAQLGELTTHAYAYSPQFRSRMDKAGLTPADIASPEGFRKLPLLTRRDIQQAGAELYCTQAPATHLPTGEAKSSGSTGQPVVIKKTAINQLFWQANVMREHFWHKRNFAGRLLNIRAVITEPTLQRGWGPAVNALFNSGDALGLPILFSLSKIIGAINDFKPEHLLIYPSTLDGLITQCQKENISITCLKHIWCVGETLKPELRHKAAAFFGALVEDDYSSNEMGIMALQCPETGCYHVMAESTLIEILDENGQPCAEGQTGKIVCTSLHNFITPMIRYDSGDYAEMGGTCSCGRGLPVLNIVKGRNRNLVVKPDGTRHWPALAYAFAYAGEPILQFQLIQHSLEDIEVRLVVANSFTQEQEANMTAHLCKALDYPFKLRFIYFEDRLPIAANGKHEDFISHVSI